MMYSFETDDGARVEIEYPIGEAPTIGDRVVIEGIGLTRVFEDTAFELKYRPCRIHAFSIGDDDPDVENRNADGVAVFDSMDQVQKYCDRTARSHERGERAEAMQYGDLPTGVEVAEKRKERIAKSREEFVQ